MLKSGYKKLNYNTLLRNSIIYNNNKSLVLNRFQSTKNTNPEINKKNDISNVIINHENRNIQLKKITIVVEKQEELHSVSNNNNIDINNNNNIDINNNNSSSKSNKDKYSNNKNENHSLSVLDKKLQELQSKPVDFHYYLRSLYKIHKGDKLPYKFGTNQLHSDIRENSTMDNILNQIIKRFDSPINYAFGYGSKVFSQGSNVDISNSQIDMIYAVPNPIEWHQKNIIKNNSDYSFLKYFGSKTINYVGELGAGIYFNPFIDLNINKTPLELKYGITSTDNLIDDLTNWSTMYLSGRLHKPVAIIENSAQLLFLNQYNLANAVKLSLLLLNKTQIKESELYLTIAGLSYMGDPRLKVKGENPDKVKNIVENQFLLFKSLYKPFLENYFPDLIQSKNSDKISNNNDLIYNINLSEEKIANIIIELPRKFRSRIFNNFKTKFSNELSKDKIAQDIIFNPSIKILTSIPEDKDFSKSKISYNDLLSFNSSTSSDLLFDIPKLDWEYLPTIYKVENSPFIKKIAHDMKENPKLLYSILSKTVEDTVGSSALIQSVKGILTAGLVRSYKYAMAKRRKYLQAQAKKGGN